MASSKKFRGALVGFGQIAEMAHSAALKSRPQLAISAICEKSDARSESARRAWPKARLYSDFELLISSEPLDFVILCTPPFLHAEQTLQALEKGLHVLCEKPLTTDPTALDKIQASAERNNKTVFTVHNWKHAPLFWTLLEKVRKGELGEIRHAELHVLRTSPATAVNSWRSDVRQAGGGILVDHGWHNLYLLAALLGRPGHPQKTSAYLAPGDAEPEASVFLQFAKSTAFMRLSWRAPERRNWGMIDGTRGSAEILDDKLVLREGGKESVIHFPEKLSAGSAHPEWLKPLLDDFLAEMTSTLPRGRNLEEARFCCDVIADIYSRHNASSERLLAAHD